MALFNKEDKELKKQQKELELLERFGLENISDPQTLDSLRSVASILSGGKLMEVGAVLSGTGPDISKMTYLRAIVETNLIIIRQLDKLTK